MLFAVVAHGHIFFPLLFCKIFISFPKFNMQVSQIILMNLTGLQSHYISKSWHLNVSMKINIEHLWLTHVCMSPSCKIWVSIVTEFENLCRLGLHTFGEEPRHMVWMRMLQMSASSFGSVVVGSLRLHMMLWMVRYMFSIIAVTRLDILTFCIALLVLYCMNLLFPFLS